MQPSKYQQAVLDAVLTGSKNLMIQAVAGSGKTSTQSKTRKYYNGN
jgi:superfamily II DNA/RNA helicase